MIFSRKITNELSEVLFEPKQSINDVDLIEFILSIRDLGLSACKENNVEAIILKFEDGQSYEFFYEDWENLYLEHRFCGITYKRKKINDLLHV